MYCMFQVFDVMLMHGDFYISVFRLDVGKFHGSLFYVFRTVDGRYMVDILYLEQVYAKYFEND